MTHSFKADEAPDPEDISLLRAQAVVAIPDALTQLIEQPRRPQWQATCKGHPWIIVVDILQTRPISSEKNQLWAQEEAGYSAAARLSGMTRTSDMERPVK
jgi:hypothetical protein